MLCNTYILKIIKKQASRFLESFQSTEIFRGRDLKLSSFESWVKGRLMGGKD